MTLFEVPGWSVTGEPVPDSPSRSKKRKRSSNDSSDKGHLPDLNMDKLVKRLKGHKSDHGASSPGNVKKDKKEKKSEQLKEQEREEKKKSISLPRPLKSATQEQSKSSTVAHLQKKHRNTRSSVESAPAAVQSPAGGEALTTMQKSMKQSLDGAKFRVINETLYKSPSNEAHEMMRDSRVFEEYHTGFRHQVQAWPTNPVKHYISLLSKYPVRTLIADLGCGDAALAKALAPLGIKVLSYDFVSDEAFVVEADICTRLPLPGSEGAEGEKTNGEGHIVDVVVCSLSLMGTNWPNSLREAWRVLKPNGELFIAEVASRFTNVDQFLSLVGSIGFKLKSKQDESNSYFTLFEFKKIMRQKPSEKEWTKVLSKAIILKPCEYKRR